MKLYFLTILMLLNLSYFNGIAQKSDVSTIKQYSNHGEVYFSFTIDELNTLPEGISIDRWIESGVANAYASDEILIKCLLEKPLQNFKVLPHPSTLHIPLMKSEVDILSIDDWDFYPTYEAYVDMMYQFEDSFPDLCKVESIGQSTEGREILMAVISDNVDQKEEESQFLYTSSIHGDETTGYVLFLRLIHYLLNNYESNARVQNLVNNLEIWINPLANPDGTYASGNNTVFGATRNNVNGVNLNRNYPDPQDGDHPDGKDWQAETLVFMDFAEENNFVMAANCHGGFEVFNYPWDTWSVLPADDNWWEFVGREWADTVHNNAPFGYFTGMDNGVTNGFQWYTINGGRQDYMNYFHHCREFTLEISSTKLLPESQLQDFWEYNYRSFLNYLEQATYGIQGIIVDEENGNPLKASVFVENHDVDESWVVSRENGWYCRPIFEGTYTISFFCPGYALKTIEGVQVENYSTTLLNVALSPSASGVRDDFMQGHFSIGNNPGNGEYMLRFLDIKPLDVVMVVTDESGKIVLRKSERLTSDNGAQVIDIQNYSDGLYFLNILSEFGSTSFKLIKN